MNELPAKYEALNAEPKWIEFWAQNKVFHSQPDDNKEKYCVVIPPPNVTGILHIGHILNNTIQDIYCRWKRMKGFEVCWVPGMDHAGISTQLMVEKDLIKKGKKRDDYTREEFVKIVWEWKEKHGGIILKQLTKLGVSVDWERERFTLDEGLSKSVRAVFVDLYKKGLIYRGKRIINWDPSTQTALSDDEVEYVEKNDKLYFVKYLLKDSSEFITIATTRPETMFGDTAVAVNPSDERYNKYKNKTVILPIVNKEIPVILDDYVDKEFGTGALKITPAHDVNDFELGQRHNLEVVNVLTKDSKLNEYAFEFAGLTINEARKKVVAKLKELGLLLKEDDYVHNVAIAAKSGATIEPYLSNQWFVSMKKLAGPALEVVREGKIKFYPERYVKVYYHWMENIRDWCISRQLWWGHQIPIWYHKETNEIYCDIKPPDDLENWRQEEDVLDTWFSSWLWPFSVFGWNNSEDDKKNRDLNYYYPTDFLVTAADIIFLWVARMIMSGLEYRGDIPFKDVYFHSVVRDGKGRKMSKTLGNSPDPIKVMERYGTDSLRFTMVYLTPLGNDVLFDEQKTEFGRNFITKLWNAGRFLMMNRERIYADADCGSEKAEDDVIEKWINSRFNSTIGKVEECLSEYRLNDYTKSLYNFVWGDFCDWYIELLKIKLNDNKNSARYLIDKALSHYEDVVKLLHPVIPFVTEEIWHLLGDNRGNLSISRESFPEVEKDMIDIKIENEFEVLKDVIVSIRNLKAENEIPYSEKCDIVIYCKDKEALDLINYGNNIMKNLCNLKNIESDLETSKKNLKSFTNILAGFEIHLLIDENIDVKGLREKYVKEVLKLETYKSNLDKKLMNKNFIEKASKEVIEKEKDKREETESKLLKLKSLLKKFD